MNADFLSVLEPQIPSLAEKTVLLEISLDDFKQLLEELKKARQSAPLSQKQRVQLSTVLQKHLTWFIDFDINSLKILLKNAVHRADVATLSSFLSGPTAGEHFETLIEACDANAWLRYGLLQSEKDLLAFLLVPNRFSFATNFFMLDDLIEKLDFYSLILLARAEIFDAHLVLTRDAELYYLRQFDNLNFAQASILLCLSKSSEFDKLNNQMLAYEIPSVASFLSECIHQKAHNLQVPFSINGSERNFLSLMLPEQTLNLTKILLAICLGQQNIQKLAYVAIPKLPPEDQAYDNKALIRFCLIDITRLEEDLSGFVLPQLYTGKTAHYWFSRACYLEFFNFLSPVQWLKLVLLTGQQTVLERNLQAWPQNQLLQSLDQREFETNFYKNIACASITGQQEQMALHIIYQDPQPWLTPSSGPFKECSYTSLALAHDKPAQGTLWQFFKQNRSPKLALYPIITEVIKNKREAHPKADPRETQELLDLQALDTAVVSSPLKRLSFSLL